MAEKTGVSGNTASVAAKSLGAFHRTREARSSGMATIGYSWGAFLDSKAGYGCIIVIVLLPHIILSFLPAAFWLPPLSIVKEYIF